MLRSAWRATPKSFGNLGKIFFHESKVALALTGADKQAYIDGGQAKNLEKIGGLSKQYAEYVNKTTENWNKMNEIYYGKERDMENYPPIKMAEYHPKVRMGFLPDNWFTAFYNKTGVTGPYLFMLGGISFLVQKEYWVIDHEFMEVIPFVMAVAFIAKKFGGRISKFLDEKANRINYLRNSRPIEEHRKQSEAMVEHAKTEIEHADGVKHVFEAKRENVDHQLESIYRQRLLDIHSTVKRRLDYHVEREATNRRFEQEHMVKWIVDSVVKGISPQQEKDALAQSIQDLKALAPK